MALFRFLPHVAAVSRRVFVIFPAQVADAEGEVEVQPPCHGQRIAVLHASAEAGAVEEAAARLTAHVAASAGFEVVCQHLAVDAEVVSRKRFFPGCLAQPFPYRDVAPVGTPVPVDAVLLPPAVHPAGTEAPVVFR